ncbi:MAG: hypothetical protein HXY27_02940 [Hydrogenophilaceae bacterium]|nr:hypothetical protein [Hydrogenophilaceae bacterium]
MEQTSVEEIEIWLRDTGENFRFILEVPESDPDKLSRMGDQFGGRALLSTEAEIKWIESEPDFRELASIIQTAVKESRPIILIMRKVNLTLMRQINELIDVLGV